MGGRGARNAGQVLQVLGVDDYIYRIYYTQELYPASLYVGY